MTLGLRRKLRIETEDIEGRLVTRVFIGDDELDAMPELRRAVAQLAAGAPVLDARRLFDAGVLERLEDATVPEGLSVRLDPQVALNLELRGVKVSLPSAEGPRSKGASPRASLPIDLFIPPFKLRPLQDLAGRVRLAWYRLLAQAQGRGRAVDPDVASTHLEAVAREELRRRPELQPVVDVEGDRLIALGSIQDDTWHYPVRRIHVYGDRRGAMTARVPDAAVALDPFADPEGAETELAAIGRLLGVLQRGATGEGVQAVLDGAPPVVEQLWRELVKGGLVPEATARPGLADGLEPGQIKHLGHATLLANLGGAFVLFDPWFIPGSASDGQQPPALCDLPELAGIFITHHHWEHVHTETLLRLDKSIPVWVPGPVEGLGPQTGRMLKGLGFEDVRTLGSGEGIDLGEGRVEAASFTGMDPTGLQYGANTYVIRHGGTGVWVHSESGPDRQGRSSVSEGEAARIAAEGNVSTVFATRRQERGTTCEYDWTWLLLPFDQWCAPTENGSTGAAFLAELTAAAGASRLVLYGEGGAEWYPRSTDFVRRGPAGAMDRVFEDGWDTVEQIQHAVSERGGVCEQAQIGQVWSI